MKDYTYEDFVRIYLESDTNAEVAEKLGIHVITVSKVAAKMRKRGVQLPERGHSGKSKTLDVEALNNLIKEKTSGNAA